MSSDEMTGVAAEAAMAAAAMPEVREHLAAMAVREAIGLPASDEAHYGVTSFEIGMNPSPEALTMVDHPANGGRDKNGQKWVCARLSETPMWSDDACDEIRNICKRFRVPHAYLVCAQRNYVGGVYVHESYVSVFRAIMAVFGVDHLLMDGGADD